jgi:hypothetical protein
MKIEYEKMTNEHGQVAVLYSPGYGAGWTTWCSTAELRDPMTFDKRLVELVLAEQHEKITHEYLENIWGITSDEYIYMGGARDLTVEWLDPGTAFEITEYDGYESIKNRGHVNWMVA